MNSSKNHGYRCKCGFEGGKEDLISHCRKNHKDDPFMLYDLIGTAADLKSANEIIKNLLIEKGKVETTLRVATSENERLVNREKVYRYY